MKRLIIAALAVLMASAPMARAQGGDDLWSHLINQEGTTAWSVQPNNPRPRVVAAPGIPGESALRIRVRGVGANPWDVQASAPIAGEIKRGDTVLLMFYARAELAAPGGSRLSTRIQLNGAPYTPTLETVETLTGEMTQHCAHAVSSQDFGANGSVVSIHLATAEQTIDLGPVFVFNLGPNYDQSKLPDCSG